MTIVDVLKRNSIKFEDKEAISEISYSTNRLKRSLSWKEFDTQANQIANYFCENGIKKGDKIAIIMKNCIEWLPVFFGILKIGAIAVPINHYMIKENIEYCVKLSECKSIVFSDELSDCIEKISNTLKISICVSIGKNNFSFSKGYNSIINNYSDTYDDVKITEDDYASIHFSSGTTGLPKAILHKHKAFIFSGIIEAFHRSIDKTDSLLCVSPLFHAGIKMHWLANFFYGGKIVILIDISPKKIMKTISEENITIAWFPVPIVQSILDAVFSGDLVLCNYDLNKWRLMHMGAQPIPPVLVNSWISVFPLVDFDISYGLTEAAGPGCINLGSENIKKSGSIGKSSLFWKTKIVDDDLQEVSPYVIGELSVKGPGVMVSYFNNESATGEKIKDGWLLTGDIGYKDQDDFIYLVGRKNDIIISGGINIYPIQVENYIKKHPSVKDVAIIGIDDLYYGEIVVAVVELYNNDCTSKDLRLYCKRLPFYEQPKKFIFSSIPKNHTGKTDKKLLIELYKNGGIK